MTQLEVDGDRCTGQGRCYAVAPELFDCDDYGHGVVIAGAEIDSKSARLAVLNCPENAIRFESDPPGAGTGDKEAVQA
jgi:ferredoxin